MSFYDIALRVLGSVPPYWRDKAARIGSAAAVKAGYRGAV